MHDSLIEKHLLSNLIAVMSLTCPCLHLHLHKPPDLGLHHGEVAQLAHVIAPQRVMSCHRRVQKLPQITDTMSAADVTVSCCWCRYCMQWAIGCGCD